MNTDNCTTTFASAQPTLVASLPEWAGLLRHRSFVAPVSLSDAEFGTMLQRTQAPLASCRNKAQAKAYRLALKAQSTVQ